MSKAELIAEKARLVKLKTEELKIKYIRSGADE